MNKRKKNSRMLLTTLIYGAASAFCLLFGTVYEQFSHGVYSPYMYLAFLIPLAGGVLPYLIMLIRGSSYPARAAVNLHASGIAALTLGSIIQGVLEIYGTTNRLMITYPIVGGLLLIAGIAAFAASRMARAKKYQC